LLSSTMPRGAKLVLRRFTYFCSSSLTDDRPVIFNRRICCAPTPPHVYITDQPVQRYCPGWPRARPQRVDHYRRQFGILFRHNSRELWRSSFAYSRCRVREPRIKSQNVDAAAWLSPPRVPGCIMYAFRARCVISIFNYTVQVHSATGRVQDSTGTGAIAFGPGKIHQASFIEAFIHWGKFNWVLIYAMAKLVVLPLCRNREKYQLLSDLVTIDRFKLLIYKFVWYLLYFPQNDCRLNLAQTFKF
jgi:hypothetical protein